VAGPKLINLAPFPRLTIYVTFAAEIAVDRIIARLRIAANTGHVLYIMTGTWNDGSSTTYAELTC
jgi:hypothetical protein